MTHPWRTSPSPARRRGDADRRLEPARRSVHELHRSRGDGARRFRPAAGDRHRRGECQRAGIYVLRYSATNGSGTTVVERTVTVADTIAPGIAGFAVSPSTSGRRTTRWSTRRRRIRSRTRAAWRVAPECLEQQAGERTGRQEWSGLGRARSHAAAAARRKEHRRGHTRLHRPGHLHRQLGQCGIEDGDGDSREVTAGGLVRAWGWTQSGADGLRKLHWIDRFLQDDVGKLLSFDQDRRR